MVPIILLQRRSDSNLILLIFTFNGERDGVGFELDYVLKKNSNFLIFVEFKSSRGKKIIACSSLLKARLKEFGKSYIEFPLMDDDYLLDIAFSRIIDYFQ